MDTCSWDSASWSSSRSRSSSRVGSECSWSDRDADLHVSLGMECTLSDEEADRASLMDFRHSTPVRETPERGPQSVDLPALNCSFASCEWSDCYDRESASPQASIDASASVRRSPRARKRRRVFDPSEVNYPAHSSVQRSQLETSVSAAFDPQSWNLFDVTSMNGCADNCVHAVHGLSEYDILSAHATFSSKTSEQQRQWIFDYLGTHCPTGTGGDKELKSITFLLGGKRVCFPVWLAVLSISSSRFYEVRKEFGDGRSQPTPKRPRSISVKSHEAIAWMSNYFERVGDKRPDKDGIYLPTCLTEKSIHTQMIEEAYLGDQSRAICFSQFNKLFRKSFPNVTIPKECRFTKCNFCTLIKNEQFKATTNKHDKTKLKDLLDQHLKLQEQERKRYYSNRQRAIESPDEVVSIIIDGMDQNKTNLPSLVRVTKSCQNLWCLRTHLTGCLVHGVGAFNYFDYLQWPHDCNLTLCTLMETLLETAKQQPLPQRLLLQMDNCVRENKNKYVLGFLAVLVETGVFSEIELGFLMVGHTHEDIDQTFSCLSRYLRKHDALTMPELEACCKASNHSVRSTSTLQYLFDIKAWLTPHLEEIHGHTVPHVFLFRRSADGRAILYTKHWSHQDWEPKQGLRILKGLPKGCPNLVTPSLCKIDLPHLERDAVKYNEAGVLTQGANRWWQEFIRDFEKSYGCLPTSSPAWYLDELLKLRHAAGPQLVPVPTVPEKILLLHQNQAEQQQRVTVGKKQKSTRKKKTNTSPKAEDDKATEQADPPTSRSSPHSVTKGCMVALRLNKYADEVPQLAKVLDLTDSDVTIEWWIGSYSDTWREWKDRGTSIIETLPRNAIVYSGVNLTKSLRIPAKTIVELKEAYSDIEFI